MINPACCDWLPSGQGPPSTTVYANLKAHVEEGFDCCQAISVSRTTPPPPKDKKLTITPPPQEKLIKLGGPSAQTTPPGSPTVSPAGSPFASPVGSPRWTGELSFSAQSGSFPAAARVSQLVLLPRPKVRGRLPLCRCGFGA